MKKFERITGLIAILAIILKIMGIDGADFLSLLAFTVLSVFYYIFSFALFNEIRLKEIFAKTSYAGNALQLVISVFLGFVISTLILGILFKLLLFSGAEYLLTIGLIPMAVVFSITLIAYLRKKTAFISSVLKRVLIYFVIGVFVYLFPTSSLIDIYYGDNPEYAALYKQVMANPENQNLKNELEQMQDAMWNQKGE